MSLLRGSVLFIDDEVFQERKPAFALASQIRASGRPVAAYESLPPLGHELHWNSLSFAVVDWDLVPGSPGGIGGSTLSEFARQELFEWLERFAGEVFCPLFVISAENTTDIERQVAGAPSLAKLRDSGRLRVFPKSVLMDDFVGYLDTWVSSRPGLAAVSVWSTEVEAAINRLFLDMDGLDSDWPVYVWRQADFDHTDQSYELATVLGANLMQRVDPLSFDIPAIREFDGETSGGAMRRIAQGRTLLRGDRLYPTMVLPGDLFSDAERDDVVWVNVTPACHTVLKRPPSHDAPANPSAIRMHVVPGWRKARPTSKTAMGKLLKDCDGPNGMVVHTLIDESPYAFDFRCAEIRTWGEVSRLRIGRLLPPYITLMQQRHAMYLLHEGLPRVDWALYSG